ncbi:MAG: hypothetical protein ABJR46_14890 [Tateyamaria sp.]|uniref:hypothetical protein n=1 Tax=Tateyamaria sp. TaxID=1929288 RepID=UPI00329BEBD2
MAGSAILCALAGGSSMKYEYFLGNFGSFYQREQSLFAEMKEQDQICKRRKRRRRILMWVLRRL